VNNHRDELSQAAGMINLDMVGVGDGLALGTIGVAGTALRDDAGELATAWASTGPLCGRRRQRPPPRSSHAGVQAVFVYQYEDPYHHTSNDTAERLDLDAMQQNGVLAAQVLWQWAGPEGELAATPTATATITGTATATATKAATAIGGASYYGWLPYVARDVIGVALAADLLAPESGTVLPSDPDATRMPDLAAMD
jgi:Zn-dependent M28 family amino/carboxypeptidase